MHMNHPPSSNQQLGMGLVEVMVSLLLLAVAVLGFSALQLRAVNATDEAIRRSSAVSAMRSLSEDMRLNPDQKKTYHTVISNLWDGIGVNAQTVSGYCTAVTTLAANATVNTQCPKADGASCTPQEQAEANSVNSLMNICNADMMMNAIACPGTNVGGRTFTDTTNTDFLPKLCLVASWNSTLPTIADTTTACMNVNGTYKRGSSCLVMETY